MINLQYVNRQLDEEANYLLMHNNLPIVISVSGSKLSRLH